MVIMTPSVSGAGIVRDSARACRSGSRRSPCRTRSKLISTGAFRPLPETNRRSVEDDKVHFAREKMASDR